MTAQRLKLIVGQDSRKSVQVYSSLHQSTPVCTSLHTTVCTSLHQSAQQAEAVAQKLNNAEIIQLKLPGRFFDPLDIAWSITGSFAGSSAGFFLSLFLAALFSRRG